MREVDNSGALGWFVIAVFAAAYDVFVIKQGRQSLSAAIWSTRQHPWRGPAVAGFWAGLSYHFFIDRPRLLEELNNE